MIRIDAPPKDLLPQEDRGDEELIRRASVSALRLLGGRDYPSKKLFDKLSSRFGERAAAAAVARMAEYGYLDDGRYCAAMARKLYEAKGFAKRRVVEQLRQQGFEPQDIEAAVEFIDTDDDEGRALDIVLKRYGVPDSPSAEGRAARLLERMGYPPRVITGVLRRARELGQDEV